MYDAEAHLLFRQLYNVPVFRRCLLHGLGADLLGQVADA